MDATVGSTLKGILTMVGAMAAAAAVDATVKALAGTVDPNQVAAVAGLGTALFFGVLARLSGQPLVSPAYLHRMVIWRTVTEVVGVYLLILALGLVSLTLFTAVMQSTPLIVTLLAVLLTGERARAQDWGALVVGFLGMLIIVRPWGASFAPESLVAVLAAAVLSLRDLASRAVPASVSSVQLVGLAGLGLGLAGLAVCFALGIPWPPLTWGLGLGYLGIVLFSAATIWGITAAMRMGSVAVISPFRYSRLVFGVGLGVVVFGERVDGATLLGAAIIAACGLYLLTRELRHRRRAP